MQFVPQQEKALAKVLDWQKKRQSPIFRLFGYAGTGKSTLARYVAEATSGTILFAAYTGKAAHVMKNKGCPTATTIHQLIYNPANKSQERLLEIRSRLIEARVANPKNEKFIADLEQQLEIETQNLKRPLWRLNSESPLRNASLLILDEVSMVEASVGEDLLSFNVPILALGDPFQLPPVKGTGFFTEVKPDVMLTDIRRQALDNPIIALSTALREGKGMPLGRYGESLVTKVKDFDPSWVFEHDQMLVGRNNTRRDFNHRMRELLGRTSALPQPEDRLVCLRNNRENGLLNGSMWTVEHCLEADSASVLLGVRGEDNEKVETIAHSCHFHGEEPDWFEKKEADEFDYGYALTVHKSQGSQWNNVLLFDEWNRPDWARWCYTGVTRAAEKVTVVKM